MEYFSCINEVNKFLKIYESKKNTIIEFLKYTSSIDNENGMSFSNYEISLDEKETITYDSDTDDLIKIDCSIAIDISNYVQKWIEKIHPNHKLSLRTIDGDIEYYLSDVVNNYTVHIYSNGVNVYVYSEND